MSTCLKHWQPDGYCAACLKNQLTAAQATIADLQASLTEFVAVGHKHGWNGVENSKILSVFFNDTITTLQAKLAEAQRDAERYRWLRDKWYSGVVTSHILGRMDTPEEMNIAIDAAIAKERGNG